MGHYKVQLEMMGMSFYLWFRALYETFLITKALLTNQPVPKWNYAGDNQSKRKETKPSKPKREQVEQEEQEEEQEEEEEQINIMQDELEKTLNELMAVGDLEDDPFEEEEKVKTNRIEEVELEPEIEVETVPEIVRNYATDKPLLKSPEKIIKPRIPMRESPFQESSRILGVMVEEEGIPLPIQDDMDELNEQDFFDSL